MQKTDATSASRIGSTIVDNIWYHVAMTWDGTVNQSGINIYVDGSSANNGGDNGSGTAIDDSGGDLWLGSRDDTLRTFMGIMDEVRISNSVRSANWIAASHK